RISLHKKYGEIMKTMAYLKESLNYVCDNFGISLEGLKIEVSSDIPLSAGLGSSAATCVATIAAIKQFFGISGDLEDIRKAAHSIEKKVQGTASPIDTAISTYGGYVLIEGDRVRRVELPEIRLIIGSIGDHSLSLGIEKGDTGLKTKKLVDGVRGRKNLFKGIFDKIFDAIEEITEEGLEAMNGKDFQKLGMLMNINHGLLEAIGVVSGRLERLVKGAQGAGALGAKVTGAGGIEGVNGGSVLVLPPQYHEHEDVISKIKGVMEMEGAFVMDTRSGAGGLSFEKGGF
ncbi:MAG: mevalonate kinase, partial [Candidatus Methanospirareceae archaeon]